MTKPSLQKILKGIILHTEDENKHNHERMEIIKHKASNQRVA
jgi:hypothetical protein